MKASVKFILLFFLILVLAFVGVVVFTNLYDPATAKWEKDFGDERKVHLEGTISGLDVDEVRVHVFGPHRVQADTLHYTIKVRDGAFSADVPLSDKQAYYLRIPRDPYFSVWYECHFFAEQDTVTFAISFPDDRWIINYFPGSSGCNMEYSSFMNSKYYKFEKDWADQGEFYDKYVKGNYYTQEYLDIRERLDDDSLDKAVRDSLEIVRNQLMWSNEYMSEVYLEARRQSDELYGLELDYTRGYIESASPSLACFLIVAESLERAIEINHDVPFWIQTYKDYYKNKYDGCQIQLYVEELLKKQSVYEGSKAYDFTLPDAEGNKQTLSKLIDGKPAVIEFWATWCGSCIINRTMVDKVHKQFKDKGFTVVCVSTEMRNDLRWRKMLGEEEHAAGWYDLLAMEPDHYVAAEYGLASAAGGCFLVDGKGTVMKINPSEEYLKQFFTDYFQNNTK
jgi:peroxiredoxin